MKKDQAVELARQGVRMTHRYFTPEEYLTMRGNMITFEDGVKIMMGDWDKGKTYLDEDWSLFDNPEIVAVESLEIDDKFIWVNNLQIDSVDHFIDADNFQILKNHLAMGQIIKLLPL